MSAIKESREAMAAPQSDDLLDDERIAGPWALRDLDARFCEDDRETSMWRATVQELKDFVPPYDPVELERRGMSSRFNINFGAMSALVNEAIGPFLDIFNSPAALMRIALDETVDHDEKDRWASIMGEEWTKMIRSWDVMASNIQQLIDTNVTHGVAIPWFEDQASLNHNIGSLEDCHFDAMAEAVPSKIAAMTIHRTMDLDDLYAKIEGSEDQEWANNWNVKAIKRLIANSRPPGRTDADVWNYEEAARQIKACRVGNAGHLPVVEIVWGVVKELNGKLSVYAAARTPATPESQLEEPTKEAEEWLYKKRFAYDDANKFFTIFTFSNGNRNRIYTIRGFGYMLYEAGQADNIVRCKLLDAAMHRASEVYQPESEIESIDDVRFIDLGHAVIAPKGLRGVQAMNTQQLDKGIGFALESNERVMAKHSAGLSSSTLVQNPNARRNELQVTAELEYTNKMQGFAISLFYGPYEKYMRELLRRSYSETQRDPLLNRMVQRMKDACMRRGVPQEVLGRIDYEATKATRLQGAGSKGSRLIAYQQLGELYASMDPQGQENFNFDFATEIRDAEAAERYFGRPGERRGHVDISLANLENNDLLEGTMVEPVPGENSMVHLGIHIEELVIGLEEVNSGQIDIAEWTMRNIPLWRHCVDTLDATSVPEAMMSQLNSYRQQVQQAGEIINNGLRHINKMRDGQGDMSQGMAPNDEQEAMEGGAPMPPEQSAAQQDNDLKMARIFAEGQAKIEILRQTSQAKIDIMKQESIARILTHNAEMQADLRRKEILARAQGSI